MEALENVLASAPMWEPMEGSACTTWTPGRAQRVPAGLPPWPGEAMTYLQPSVHAAAGAKARPQCVRAVYTLAAGHLICLVTGQCPQPVRSLAQGQARAGRASQPELASTCLGRVLQKHSGGLLPAALGHPALKGLTGWGELLSFMGHSGAWCRAAHCTGPNCLWDSHTSFPVLPKRAGKDTGSWDQDSSHLLTPQSPVSSPSKMR